jgi:hypothetical protein
MWTQKHNPKFLFFHHYYTYKLKGETGNNRMFLENNAPLNNYLCHFPATLEKNTMTKPISFTE